jgi:hypothetical protein
MRKRTLDADQRDRAFRRVEWTTSLKPDWEKTMLRDTIRKALADHRKADRLNFCPGAAHGLNFLAARPEART